MIGFNRKAYPKVKKQVLKENPTCQCCGFRDSEDVHHIKLRSVRPDLLLDKGNLLAICLQCHGKIHSNPKWARENGYLKRSNE